MRQMLLHRNAGTELQVLREGKSATIGTRELQAGDGEVVIVGHAVKWDSVADLGWWTESFRKGAFADVIGADADIRFLLSHRGLAIARTTNSTLEFWEDDIGLGLRAVLNVDGDPDAARAVAKIERGDVTGLSVGFSMRGGKYETEYFEDGGMHDTIIKVGKLYETSLVTFPAYEDSEVAVEREARMAFRLHRRAPEGGITSPEDLVAQHRKQLRAEIRAEVEAELREEYEARRKEEARVRESGDRLARLQEQQVHLN